MTYASSSDIADLYGAEALARLSDSDGDGTSEGASVTRALTYADAQVNAYIGVRYALPLPAVPSLVTMLAIDIAVYRLAQDHTRLTDEIVRRYEDAIRQLRAIADGKAVLPIATDQGEPVAAPADTIVTVEGPGRIFERGTLRRL